MPVTTTLPILRADEVLDQLRAMRSRQPVRYWAFYSSQLGGIVTDPALMVIPFDDHMVHRGHGVFDTAAMVDGKIYDLEAHLDRFIRSAPTSRLACPARGRRCARSSRAPRRPAASATAPSATGSRRGPEASACRPPRAPRPASSS